MHIPKRLLSLSRGRLKIFLTLQALALLAGNLVGWTTIAKETKAFCTNQGHGLWSLTSFSGTATKNPLLTPCFWGSVVFIIGLAWSISLLLEHSPVNLVDQVRKLWWLMFAGTVFALANNVLPLYRFYTKPVGTLISCSNSVVTNPYLTSCFLGFSAFLAAFIFASMARLSLAAE